MLGPQHPFLVAMLGNFGIAQARRGDLDQAIETLQRSLALAEKLSGPEQPEVAITLDSLGDTYLDKRDFTRARAAYRRAIAIFEAKLGPTHPYLAYPLTGIGQCELASGAARLAVPPLERSLALSEQNPGDPTDLAETRFALARALWDTHRDRKRAETLARQALDGFIAAGGAPSRKPIEDVRAWLEHHTVR